MKVLSTKSFDIANTYPFDIAEFEIELDNGNIVYLDAQKEDLESYTSPDFTEFWVYTKSYEELTDDNLYEGDFVYEASDEELNNIYNLAIEYVKNSLK